MSPKEMAVLLLLLAIGVVAVLGYTDVYPPSDWTDRSHGGDDDSIEPKRDDLPDDAAEDAGTTSPETTTGPPAAFPPGLTRDHVENPAVFARTHRDVLLEAGSWTRHATTVVYANGTDSATSVRTAKVSGDGELAAGTVVVTGDRAEELGLYGPDLAYWANDSLTVVRYAESNRTSTIEPDDRYPVPFDVESTEWRTLYRLFAGTDTTFDGSVDRDGTTYYRVVATKGRYYDSPYGDVHDLTLSALVTGEGLVEEYVVTFRRWESGHETRVVVRVEYTDVGTTGVDRPEWVPKAPKNVSQTPDTATDAGVDSIETPAMAPRNPGSGDRPAADRDKPDPLPRAVTDRIRR